MGVTASFNAQRPKQASNANLGPSQISCVAMDLTAKDLQFQGGADDCREHCPTAARGMISAREPGRSRHWASTAGGRNVRACQMSNGSARKAVDHQPGTGSGRPARDPGEAVRNRPLFAGPRGTRDSPLRSQKASEASLFDLGYRRYLFQPASGSFGCSAARAVTVKSLPKPPT
jgi:hypothetical protein